MENTQEMTIIYTNENIFDSPCDALVNPINCVGVMGKGLALQFKNKYPKMFEAYRLACQKGWVAPGRLFVYPEEDGKLIIGFPTKIHWKDQSKIEYLEAGLIKLKKLIEERSIRSIAIPALGCGLGQLRWNEVKPLMESHLSDIENIIIHIHLPLKG